VPTHNTPAPQKAAKGEKGRQAININLFIITAVGFRMSSAGKIEKAKHGNNFRRRFTLAFTLQQRA